MQQVDKIIQVVAPKEVGITLIGESGTGKEVLARRIHELSPRRAGPSCRSTVRPSRSHCSKANCSGTNAVHSPERANAAGAKSKHPAVALCSWTRSEKCR